MRHLFLAIIVIGFYFCNGYSQTIVFQDDFEDGNAFDWDYENGWQVILEDTNHVFEGIGHKWATPKMDFVNNATFQADFKLVSGGYHFNVMFRSGRYFFPIHPTFIQFMADESPVDDVTIDVGEDVWHTVKVTLEATQMKFFLDDSLLFEYDDSVRLALFGKPALEGGDHIYVDNVLATTKAANQQESQWVRTGGPLGGIGYDVRVDPTDANIIYVSDVWAGVHKSYDAGKTWHPRNEGIISRTGPTGDAIPIFSLTVDPNDPNIIWCGTRGKRGVYKSVDKAEHWELNVNGIPDTDRLSFRSFAIQPGNSDIVYCGTEWALSGDEIPAGQSSASMGKIYKTSDGGESWTEVLMSDALVRTIVIDPVDPNIVYAATGFFDRDDVQEMGIWKSTNAGESWENITRGMSNLTVGDIEMDPQNRNILLATSGRLSGFGGGPNAERGEILRSIDGGHNWTRQFGWNPGQPFTYVEIDESNPNIVYAAASDRGFFKSVNRGLTWQRTTYNPPYVNPGHIISITTHKDKPNWLITNSYGGGVFVSEDGANSWKAASQGYTGCEIADIAVARDNPLKIYAVARSSVFRSLDGGDTWHGIGAMRTTFNNVPMGPLEMRSIAVHPNNSNVVLAGDQERAIFRTTDGGKRWATVFMLPGDEINTIAYSPSVPSIVYAGAVVRGGYTIDRPFPFNPTRPSLGMLKSTDGGLTWDYINNGLETTKKNVNDIAVHPTNRDIVYIGTLNSGVYKTVDGGDSWFAATEGIQVPDVRALALDRSHPDVLYAGSQNGGIYKTTDAGLTWQPSVLGMDPEAAIRSIVIDPTNSQIVYAGDWSTGVYRSKDGGQTWWHINDGLRTRAVQRLALSEDGKVLYAGTQGEGVFR
ncbi:MAG: WD40/YVTN/BNR-like repeat-containing protein, partial [bacterium]